jgi:hypothetical protein
MLFRFGFRSPFDLGFGFRSPLDLGFGLRLPFHLGFGLRLVPEPLLPPSRLSLGLGPDTSGLFVGKTQRFFPAPLLFFPAPLCLFLPAPLLFFLAALLGRLLTLLADLLFVPLASVDRGEGLLTHGLRVRVGRIDRKSFRG